MTQKHLLFWIFKVFDEWPQENNLVSLMELCEDDFTHAPAWVWPAFQQKISEYEKEKGR